MLADWTLPARRAVFFARYAAGRLGSPEIETEHLLLGLLKEDQALFQSHFPNQGLDYETVFREILESAPARTPIPTSVDMPLSEGAKRSLDATEQSAPDLGTSDVNTKHILLGLAQDPDCAAMEILRQHGVDPLGLRKGLGD